MSKHQKITPGTPPVKPPRRPIYPVLAGLLLLVGLGVWLFLERGGDDVPGKAPPPSASAQPASLVDEGQCAGCHVPEAKAWEGSHHQLAMQEANESSVLGDFKDASFSD